MKIIAYLTDCCDRIKTAKEVVGIIPTQDAFDKYNSYPINPNPERSDIHYCIECYNKLVLSQTTKDVIRKDDEEGYQRTLKIQFFALKELAIKNYNHRLFKQKMRSKK